MGNIDELARLMGYDGKSDEVSLGYGLVTAISESSVTCDYKGATIDAVKCCNPNVGDIVAIEAQGGQTRAIAVRGGEQHEEKEQTHIYVASPNLIDGATWRQGSNSDSTSKTRITCERVIALKANKKYTVASTNSDTFWPVYLSICQADGTHIQNTSTNAHPLLEYTPTSDCYVRVVYGTSTVGNITTADVATFKPVMVEGNSSWIVMRTGDHVELDGVFYGMQAKSSSTTNHSDFPEFPLAFDAGRTEDGGYIPQVTRCRYQVSNAAVMRDGAERTKMKIYTTIAAVSADFTYETYLHVAGKSTSDVAIRSASTSSGSWTTMALDEHVMHLVGNGASTQSANIRLQTMVLPAGTYLLGLDCADKSAEDVVIEGAYHLGDIDVTRSFETLVVLGTASTGLSNALALSRVNGIPLDSTMKQAMPHLTNELVLTEPTEVKWYAYAVSRAGEPFDYVFTPWIRRIA